MANSQEVRFKISGDTTGLASEFNKTVPLAEAAGRRVEAAFRKASQVKQNLTPGQAKAADREYADAVKRVALEQRLADAKRKRLFDEANTLGKIRIIESELVQLERQRDSAAAGTTKQLQAQLSIEERKSTLLRLNQQQAKEASRNTSTPGARGGDSDGGTQGVFSGANIFRAVGGAIAAGLQRVIAWNESRVRVDEAKASAAAVSTDSMRETIAQIGGLNAQLQQGQGRVKDLKREQEFYASRASFLSEGAQGAVSYLAPEELTKAQEKVAQIGAMIQQQGDQNQLTQRELNRQNQLLNSQENTVGRINAARRQGRLNEMTLAEIELDRLKYVEKIERAYGTPERARAAGIAVQEQKGVAQGARMAMLLVQQNANTQLTQQVAQGRTFRNGRPRPRSEAERLADRAESQRQQAQNIAVTGSGALGPRDAMESPWDRRYGRAIAERNRRTAATQTGTVGSLIGGAIRDEATVAGRLARSTGTLAANPNEQNLAGIKPEIVKSNTLLSAIKDSLTVVAVEMK